MRYLDEYRDAAAVSKLAEQLRAVTTQPWCLMEVCGGQTHSIVRHGLDQLLPESVELVHGPGCPVCVTPSGILDRAVALALRPEVIFCSFGDMLRVPGGQGSLMQAKSRGADVRIVYSPLDALALAEANPDREVVFFAVGFETTAPANAMAVYQAEQRGIDNFSVLVSHFRVPPAIESILQLPGTRIDGFLAAGHVCTIMGTEEYEPIARDYGVPIVVTGFEPVDILEGVLRCVAQLEQGRGEVENQYTRSVSAEGNPAARRILETVFRPSARDWRGLGALPASGLALAPEYAAYDALQRFELGEAEDEDDPRCISGRIMQGLAKPGDCPHFGRECTPEHPLGAPMVSNEGACSAYFRHRLYAAGDELSTSRRD